MSDYDEILRRSQEAEFLLGHSLMNEAFASIENRYVNAWKNSPYGDDTSREIAYHILAGLAEFKTQLRGYLDEVNKIRHNHEHSDDEL